MLTVGYGHTGLGVREGRITEERALELLRQDLNWAEEAVAKHVSVPLTQNQFDALVSFVFNIGETQFADSTLLEKLNQGNYNTAAKELPKWRYDNGKILRGLIRRRKEERAIFLA